MRDTSAGPGLLIVEGRQYQFPRQGVWRSEVSPRPGMVVDVEFDVLPSVAAITAVPAAQLAREHAEADKQRPHDVVGSGRVGSITVAAAALIVAWFFLTALSLDTPLGGEHFTFWQLLSLLGARNPLDLIMPGGATHTGAGLYAIPAVLALSGPFAHLLFSDRRACLGGMLPLIFMTIVGLMIRGKLDTMLVQHATESMSNLAAQTKYEVMQSMSLGTGAYVSLLAGAYLAAEGSLQYLAARTSHSEVLESYKAST